MALTDVKARKAQSADRDYKLTDEKGLFLLVRPNGSKLWRHRYRFEGREKSLSYGPYPEVGLAEARQRRDDARRLLREGKDPSLEKKKLELSRRIAAMHSFEAVAEEWLELQQPRWAPSHYTRVRYSLERDVYPYLGKMPLAEIDAPIILEVLRKIERHGAVESAKRVRQQMSAVFVHGIACGVGRDDPAALVQKALRPKPPVVPQPALLKIDALKELIAAVEASGSDPVVICGSRLLALTAVRPGVIRWAEWHEFLNLDWESSEQMPEATWRVPAAKMKLAQDRKVLDSFDHHVPLSSAAVDVLRAIRKLTGRCKYVFANRFHSHRPISENTIGNMYNRLGWTGRHVPHGWRAAFSTIMNEWAQINGRADDRAVIDLMLAHIPGNKVEAAYNRAQFMGRRRQLAEIWSAMLMGELAPASDLLVLERRRAHYGKNTALSPTGQSVDF